VNEIIGGNVIMINEMMALSILCFLSGAGYASLWWRRWYYNKHIRKEHEMCSFAEILSNVFTAILSAVIIIYLILSVILPHDEGGLFAEQPAKTNLVEHVIMK